MTTARFHQLSELPLEAADYVAGEDGTAAALLCEMRALVVALGEREATSEQEVRLQLELPGLGPR